MEIFRALKVDEGSIELTSQSDLEAVYNNIMDNKNFILFWDEKDVEKSKVIVSEGLAGKLKVGQLVLTSTKS